MESNEDAGLLVDPGFLEYQRTLLREMYHQAGLESLKRRADVYDPMHGEIYRGVEYDQEAIYQSDTAGAGNAKYAERTMSLCTVCMYSGGAGSIVRFYAYF